MNQLVETYNKILRVFDLLSEGRTLTSACDEVKIGIASFKKHVESQEELQELFGEAERRGYDTLADVLLEINTHQYYGTAEAKMATVLSNNIKWYLSKRRPAQYGEKITVENIYTLDRTIVDALSRAKDRALGIHVAQDIIDVPFQVIEDKTKHVRQEIDEEAELAKLM